MLLGKESQEGIRHSFLVGEGAMSLAPPPTPQSPSTSLSRCPDSRCLLG